MSIPTPPSSTVVVTTSQFAKMTDIFASIYIANKGISTGDTTSALGYGRGSDNDYGVAKGIANLKLYLLGDGGSNPGVGDYTTVDALNRTVEDIRLNVAPVAKSTQNDFSKLMNALSLVANNSGLTGVTDINTFLTYYNTGAGGTYASLVSPQFAEFYQLSTNSSTSTLSITNIYSVPIPTMGTQVAGGSFTAGTAVTEASYAGAAVCTLTGTGISGSSGGVVTVTGRCRKSDGTVAAGRTFTGTVATSPSNQTIVLSPTNTGDLLCSVTSISLPGGISGGTFIVNGLAPSGRNYPPY